MAYIIKFPEGIVKPPLGGIPNPEHPFMKGHLMSLLFDGAGTFPLWRNVGWDVGGGSNFGGPTILTGGETRPREASLSSAFADAGWWSNQEGLALRLQTAAANVNLGESSFLPTTGVTVLVVRRMWVNTAFTGGQLFQLAGPPANDQTFYCAAPYNGDNNTYLRFGGVAGANNLNGDIGIGDGTSDIPQRFVFSAGPAGMRVWFNGVRKLKSETAVTRTASTADLLLNGIVGFGASDVEINYFHIIDYQWPDNLCRWWSAEPYDHLYIKPVRYTYFLLPGLLTIEVNAGPNQSVNAFTTVTLAGSGTGTTYLWTVVSGPGGQTFVDATSPTTNVTFTISGVYVFRLTATNVLGSASDDVQITIVNVAPVVSAGPDQTVLLGTAVTTAGSATDDGLPIPPGTLTILWTKISGPGTATFLDSADPTTTVTFSAAGVYVLQLSGYDGEKTTTDTMSVTVSGDCVAPSADPTFDCG